MPLSLHHLDHHPAAPPPQVRFVKIASIFLMSMSFLVSILVVFAATETSTQMLGKGSHEMHPKYRKEKPYSPLAASPIALLVREYEMEYIIVRAGFFQSLGSSTS